MSMKTRWQEGAEQREMTSPLSLVISAFARVEDVRRTVTPQLATEDNALLLIDLGKGNNALGATALAQVYRQLGDVTAGRARCRAAERLLGRNAGAGGRR
ncbi:phosphoribosylformylglycinamidine synthase [Klebsiella michiganensis]|uniref:Phosphoribosylformylglycinamidine synthase n=1 Tax=Klebsiella michiganensis TaxID=1134687 RepID=A0A7H4PN76_9ENTR|nr:phosphoribosylformylglycinamidine synthase [Klebsiella michiganensis]